jgi:hypothetical protein
MNLKPSPEDGVCYLVVDSTVKDKTGLKHPLAKKGHLNEYAPYVFGLHLVVVMLHWWMLRLCDAKIIPLSLGRCAVSPDADPLPVSSLG